MTANPLSGVFGQLIMSGWVGTDPRDGRDIAFLYLGTPGDGASGAAASEVMPAVARALGLGSRPGSMTEHPTEDTHVTFTADGWIDLRYPGGDGVQHPGSAEWRAVAEQRGEAVLTLTYLPMVSEQGADRHCDRSLAAGQVVLGLIPVGRP